MSLPPFTTARTQTLEGKKPSHLFALRRTWSKIFWSTWANVKAEVLSKPMGRNRTLSCREGSLISWPEERVTQQERCEMVLGCVEHFWEIPILYQTLCIATALKHYFIYYFSFGYFIWYFFQFCAFWCNFVFQNKLIKFCTCTQNN